MIYIYIEIKKKEYKIKNCKSENNIYFFFVYINIISFENKFINNFVIPKNYRKI